MQMIEPIEAQLGLVPNAEVSVDFAGFQNSGLRQLAPMSPEKLNQADSQTDTGTGVETLMPTSLVNIVSQQSQVSQELGDHRS
jgi:hypothetical protein